MPALVEQLFGPLLGLVTSAVKPFVEKEATGFAERRRVLNAVDNSVARVVESLDGFLENEHITEQQRLLVVEACTRELEVLTREPDRLFRGGLEPKAVFEELYAQRPYPAEIRDEGLELTYALVAEQVIALLTQLAASIREWQVEHWREGYRRLDEIAEGIARLHSRLDEMASDPTKRFDPLLHQARRAQAQTLSLKLDVTALRAESPKACGFDEMFVHPDLIREGDNGLRSLKRSVGTLEQACRVFLKSGVGSLVVGEPGAGKSTWTLSLQRAFLNGEELGLAVRTTLRRYADQPLPGIRELVTESLGIHLAGLLIPEMMHQWIEQGRIAFLFDGFDELPLARRDDAVVWLRELRSAAPACPVVVTSRPLTTSHIQQLASPDGNGVARTRWTLLPFDHSRIITYIERWYAHAPMLEGHDRIIDAAALSEQWQAEPTIGPLTGNPLLLATLLTVHHLDGKLPNGRAKLYGRYIDGMLGIWDERGRVRAASVDLTSDQKRHILARIALHMQMIQHDQLEEEVCRQVVAKVLSELALKEDVEAVLATLRERSGLLVGPGLYDFAHKSVAEFLVAELVVQGNQRDQDGQRVDRYTLDRHRHDDRWNTVMFFWAGLAPARDVEELIVELLARRTWADFALAFGLLQDQLHRLHPSLRRQAVLALIEASKTLVVPPGATLTRFIRATLGNNEDRRLYHPTIRGLSSFFRYQVSLPQLLDTLVEDGAATWQEALSAAEPVREWFLRSALRSLPDRQDWLACFSAFISTAEDAQTRYFRLTAALYVALLREDYQTLLLEVAALYTELVSENIHRFPLLLLLSSISYEDDVDFFPKAYNAIKVWRVLGALGTLELDEEWLRLSARMWYADVSADLLALFGQALQELVETSPELEHEVTAGLIWIDGQLERRKRLLEADPLPPEEEPEGSAASLAEDDEIRF